MNSIKFIKIQKNKTLFNKVKSENNDSNLVKNILKSDEEYIPQLINKKLNLFNNKHNKKLILPIAYNKINQMKIINNDETKKENYIKYIFNGVKEKIRKNNCHEYDIKFNNSYLKNINWNNNVLKKIFRNKKMMLNMELIKNYKIKKNESKEKEKEKETKELNILKNINNFYDNSYFNSEINNFYNNCKYKNNKLILSLMRKRNINKSKRIYLSRFNENIYYNYCVSNINENESKRSLPNEKEKNKNSSVNNSLFRLNNFY